LRAGRPTEFSKREVFLIVHHDHQRSSRGTHRRQWQQRGPGGRIRRFMGVVSAPVGPEPMHWRLGYRRSRTRSVRPEHPEWRKACLRIIDSPMRLCV
jgi:hypothetical protein